MGRLPVIIMLAVLGWFFLWPDSEEVEYWEPVGWTHKIDEAHVRVFWQEDGAAVNEAFEEYWEVSLFGEELSGWAASDDPDEPGFDPKTHRCDFYLVEPKYVDDDDMLALGHEAYHCFRGDFHKSVTEVDK